MALQKPIEEMFRGPFLGLLTTRDETAVDWRFAQHAQNVILADGRIRPRAPWVPIKDESGADLHLPEASPGFPDRVISIFPWRRRKSGVSGFEFEEVYLAHLRSGELWRLRQNSEAVQLAGDVGTIPVTFVLVHEWVYLLGATERPWKTDGTPEGTCYVGLMPPVAPTGSVVGAGAPGIDADVSYVITKYDSETQVESNHSEITATYSPGGNQGVELYIPASSNSPERVSHYRIYRRNHTLGQVWYRLVGEIPFTYGSSYFKDEQAEDDISLSDTITGPWAAQRNGPIVNASTGVMFQGRLWFNDRYEPGIVRFSAIDHPDHCAPLDYVSIHGDPDDRITGLLAIADRLLIGKSTAIYELTGQVNTATNDTAATGAEPLESNEVITKTAAEVGPMSPVHGGFFLGGEPSRILFAAATGVYQLIGELPRKLSKPIDPTWREILQHTAGAHHGFSFAHDRRDNVIYVCSACPGYAGDVLLAYHPGIDRGDGLGAWTTIDGRLGGLQSLAIVHIACVASALPGESLSYDEPGLVVGGDDMVLLAADTNDPNVEVPYWQYESAAVRVGDGCQVHVYQAKWLLARAANPTGRPQRLSLTVTCQTVGPRGATAQSNRIVDASNEELIVMPVRCNADTVTLTVQPADGPAGTAWDRDVGVLGWQIDPERVGQR